VSRCETGSSNIKKFGVLSFDKNNASISQIEIPSAKLPYLRGWVYGPVRNDAEKTHPLLVPFEELPRKQKSKGRNAYETLFNLYENNRAQ
jgi:hypothetical protein